jgi:endonuclease YncB( thermonuclease family)
MSYRAALACLLLIASPAPALTEDLPRLPGVVVGVIDGDTVDVRLESGMIRVRLHGIDAPEHDQPHGVTAKKLLSSLVYRETVELEPVEQDRYERLVARVWLADLDVDAEMVRRGEAWVYRRYASDPAYCEYEFAARSEKRGLWSLHPQQRVAPWEWRRRRSISGSFTDYSQQTVAACVASLGR